MREGGKKCARFFPKTGVSFWAERIYEFRVLGNIHQVTYEDKLELKKARGVDFLPFIAIKSITPKSGQKKEILSDISIHDEYIKYTLREWSTKKNIVQGKQEKSQFLDFSSFIYFHLFFLNFFLLSLSLFLLFGKLKKLFSYLVVRFIFIALNF